MKFSVIYSIDVPEGYLFAYKGRMIRLPRGRYVRAYGKEFEGLNTWAITEDGETEYSYLADEDPVHCSGWRNGRHRKVVGLVDRAGFERFLDQTCLSAEATETMGSIGAPGFGIGWAPAISFYSDAEDEVVNAYVTPIPEPVVPRKDGTTERDWHRIKAVICRRFIS